MQAYEHLSKSGEIAVLQQLYKSIEVDGPIKPDESGFFTSPDDKERTAGLEYLQDKYTYGWYIAEQKEVEQLNSLNVFMYYIDKNYYE